MPISQPSDSREQYNFESLLRRTVIIPIVALAILAASLLWGIQSLRNASQWVDHTDRVISASQELLKLVIDMETGVRGYLDTGNDEFLQPYNEAKADIDSRFDALNQQVADNPSQQARLAAIRISFDQWRLDSERAIALRRGNADGGHEAALGRKRLMDSLRAKQHAFVATEERLRNERVQASRKAARLLIVNCILLSLGIGGFLAIFTRRQMHLLGARFQESLDVAETRAESLREAEERSRLMIDAITDYAIFMLDPEGRVATWNTGAQRMKGYTAGEILGKYFSCFYRPEDIAAGKPQRELAIAAEQGKYAEEDWRVRQNGSLFLASVTITAVHDAAGQLRGFAKITRDITERKQAEEVLRSTQAKLQGIVGSAMDAIVSVDEQQRIVVFNRAAELVFQCEASQAVGSNLDRFIPESLRQAHHEHIQHFGSVGVTARSMFSPGRLTAVRSNGEEFPIEATISQVQADGEKLYTVILRDITEREQAEESLRSSEQRWATTLQSIGDAVISTDGAGNIEFMNSVAQKLTGWTLPEAEGRALTAVFDIIQEVTRIKPENPVAKVIRLGKVIGLANHTVLIHRDGTEIPIEDSAAPIRDTKGQMEGVVLVFHDVLEQRKVEATLRNSDRLATTGKLAATIAHEIHNPLDAVGNLLFLIGQDAKDDTIQQYVSLASVELARVTQMTRQMLAFQREATTPVPVKIGEILESVTALFERKITSAGIRLEQQIDFDGHILVQPGELRQIFANLVGNAIEAMGTRRGTITLRAYESQDRRRGLPGLRVLVADDGPGIPEHVRGKIFDPFFTTKGEGGTGLGLWIASDILRKYDGTMRLRSCTHPDRSGTCFSVFLPFEISPDSPVRS